MQQRDLGKAGLYTFEGRPYIRVGASTSVMPKSEYEHRLITYLHASERWENQIAHGIALKDLDHKRIRLTFREARKLGRLDVPATNDIASILRGFELYREGHLINRLLKKHQVIRGNHFCRIISEIAA